jgi:Zn-dependent protease with chaperone function
MAILTDCPHCQKQFQVKDQFAGRSGKCPGCQRTIQVPSRADASGIAQSATTTQQTLVRPASSAESAALVQSAFQGTIKPPQLKLGRKLGTLLSLAVLLVMPLFYGAVLLTLVGVMAWLPMSSVSARIPPAALWIVEIIAGIVLICLLKPLVDRKRNRSTSYELKWTEENALAALSEEIGRQVGAPMPVEVRADCSTRCVLSRSRGRHVLTIGLPLVACVSVEELTALIAGQLAVHRAGAMGKTTSVIRGINAWLWESVYGATPWDAWLIRVAERPRFTAAKLLVPLRAIKLVSQAVLFVPLFIANTIASHVVRQAELDADRCAVQLVGGTVFTGLLERLAMIDFAWQGILLELDFLHGDHQLPDSLPQQLALRMLDMTPEVYSALRETAPGDDGPLDSRASEADRLAIARETPGAGVLTCSLPASAMLTDYPSLARKMTFDYYVSLFGPQLLKTGMKPVLMPEVEAHA